MFDVLPFFPWWAELIIIALAIYGVFNRRKALVFWGKVLLPHEVRQRWDALASKKDVQKQTNAMGDTIVEKLTEEFVEQLPELLSDDLTEKVRADMLKLLPKLVSDRLVDRVLAKLPEAMEGRAQKTIANLTAQVNALRKQVKGGNAWVPVGIHVRGFKLNDEDTKEYFAVVEYNVQTQLTRADPNSARRVLVPGDMLDYVGSPFSGIREKYSEWLGAPWYGKVNGDPKSIVMLGEAYTLFRG